MSEGKTTEPEDEGAAAGNGRAAANANADANEPVGAGAGAPEEPAAASEPAAAASASDTGAGPGTLAGGASALISGMVPRLAIVVAVFASLIAGALWWQYRQFYVELAGQDQVQRENLEAARASLRGLEDEVEDIRDTLAATGEASDARIAAIEDDLTALPAAIRDVERRVEALQGGRLDARELWLREQAEYYLVLANTEARLGRRIGSSIEALELADDVLRELGDPALADVRRAIASELQALRAVATPDLDRLVLDLRGLLDRVEELPMRAQAPENFGTGEDEIGDVEPGLGRLLERTRGAVTSIVRVERQEGPVEQLLTETERRVVRRQLALELQLARTAVLEERQTDFRESLVAADTLLNRDFNREARSVIAARELLAGMMEVELAPTLPAIGDSLSLLRNAPGVE